MKSKDPNTAASFILLFDRLIETVLLRLNNGEITERSLARLAGTSQPQLHNVLKGKRRLQPELADRLLRIFDLSVYDLLADPDTRPGTLPVAVPAASDNPGTAGAIRKAPGREFTSRSRLHLTA